MTIADPFFAIHGWQALYSERWRRDGLTTGCHVCQFLYGKLRKKVFRDQPNLKPSIYCRYVDDCFIVAELSRQVTAFNNESGLNFTVEHGRNNKLNFLDVEVSKIDGNYTTAVYRKPTNTGLYLNPLSERPDRYK